MRTVNNEEQIYVVVDLLDGTINRAFDSLSTAEDFCVRMNSSRNDGMTVFGVVNTILHSEDMRNN